jgi:hypothetical protein
LSLTAWRFPLVLALLLSFLMLRYPAEFGGDVIEYTLDTVALADHRSPDIRDSDIEHARRYAPHLSGVYDILKADMQAQRPKVYPAFVRGREGKVYPIHFFGYCALAAVPFKALEKVGAAQPFSAFVIVNLAAVFVLGLALRRFFGSEMKAYAGVMLFMLCGGVLYFPWTSPECVSAALLLAGLLLFASGVPVWGSVLAGLAGQQNPTILFFFGFAPLLLALRASQDMPWRAAIRTALGKRNLAGLAAGVAVFSLPMLFNLYQYGVPNIIAKLFSDPKLVGLVRLESFYFDLNQGMILAIPAVLLALLAWGWGSGREARVKLAIFAACAAFTLALALPALAVLNWNSGAAGVMRYAFWAAMPFLFALLLRLRDRARWPGAVIALLAAAQLGCMWHASSYRYIDFSPLAQAVLDEAPDLYHPEPEIFAERAGHNDDYIFEDKVYVLRDGQHAIKSLYNITNPDADSQLCGQGAAIAATNRFVDSHRGWRYIDGPVRCVPDSRPRRAYSADQFSTGDGFALGAGWSKIEHSGGTWDGTWSVGARSSLVLAVPPTLQPSTLRISGTYLDGNARTRVTINGIDVGWHQLDREQLTVPQGAREARQLTVELEHEAPHSPGPADPRPLAFFLHKVELRGTVVAAARKP